VLNLKHDQVPLDPPSRGLDPAHPIPFEEIVAPLVGETMRRIVDHEGGRTFGRFSGPAIQKLARTLLQRLSGLSAPVLLDAFDVRRPRGPQLVAQFLQGVVRTVDESVEAPRIRYDALVEEMTRGGFAALLTEYPVLADLITQIRASLVDRAIELAAHLEADLPAIIAAFGWAGDPGEVVALRLSLSDPHHHGRSVTILTFASGASLVHKPRDLQLDAAFHRFQRHCDPTATPLAYLVMPDHGWMEMVEPSPGALPINRLEGTQVAHSAGRLLALLYLLGGSDCHLENLLVRDGELILIDAETALHPELFSVSNCDLALGDIWPWDSVARTGLLPRWSFSAGAMAAFDVSALGARDDMLGSFEEPRWRNINTDLMARGIEADPAGVAQGRERLDVDALVDGFTAMYRHLYEHRDTLRTTPEFRDLGSVRARLVVRATRQYGEYLQSSLVGDLFRDASARRASLAELPVLGTLDDPLWAALREAEITAMERMDLPRFMVPTRGGAVDTGDKILAALPGLREAFADSVSRFDRMGEVDLNRQIAVIRGSFAAIRVRTVDPVAEPMPFPDQPLDTPSVRRRLVDAALGLADDLVTSALPTAEGGMHWLDLRRHERIECYSLQRAGLDLYDGNAGIAVFLAAAASVSARADLAEIATRALQPVRQLARRPQDNPHSRLVGIGAGTGTGSLLYALTRCAVHLRNDDLIEDALLLAESLDDCDGDKETDALAGAAGAIIGLLTLHAHSGRAELLDRAVAIGNRLLAAPPEKARLTGVAHGAAGVAIAWFRLAHASGQTAFRAAGREALAFERGAFDSDACGWPDFRFGKTDGAVPCSTMWCHGAPGIGLSRLALLDLEEDSAFAGEIEAAIHATRHYGLRRADHLCCGNFGRIDLLVEAGHRLGDAGLLGTAAAAAEARLDLRERTGSFGLSCDDAPEWLKPSLFRGIAGVGYELLRIAAPADVASVLIWN
jgi:type 2 lantibiotic biosynthesis protein LanM